MNFEMDLVRITTGNLFCRETDFIGKSQFFDKITKSLFGFILNRHFIIQKWV